MCAGNNPTALASRSWLVDALLALMESEHYAKITVKDIYKKTDLSRQTFYYFFDTKDEIVRSRIGQCYEEMMDGLKSKEPFRLSDITGQFMATFEHNQPFISMIISHQLDYLLEFELARGIRSFTNEVDPQVERHVSEYSGAFLAGAIAHMVLHWFKDEQPLIAQQVSRLLSDILAGEHFRIDA